MKRAQTDSRRLRPEFMRRPDGPVFSDNEKQLLNLVRAQGPLSRADLARHTDLAMQSVVRLVEGLIERGFLRPGERVVRAGPGQPSVPMWLVPDAALTFGVSIMTDAISIVLLDLEGRVRASLAEAIDVSDRQTVVAHIQRKLDQLAAAAGVDPSRIFGVGVAMTGYFVSRTEINTPASMSDWALLDLERVLSTAFNLPVWVENDGNAAAVGESLYGVGDRIRDFAYIYIAGGLGGGVIVDGRLQRGWRGNAGEFTGILPESARGDRPTLSLLLSQVQEHGAPVQTIGEMVETFDASWPGVDAWLERTGPSLTAILSAIGASLDPEAIVIGGRTPPVLAKALAARAQYYEGRLRERERPLPTVLAAEAKGDAAALGAAALPLKQHFFG